MKNVVAVMIAIAILSSCKQQAENNSIYRFNRNAETRWSSFENINGTKAGGGKENNCAKGHACDSICAGKSQVLLDVQGSGIINRMWFTINDRSPEMLRSLKIEMFWDGESRPAVSAPFGDFFGTGLSRRVSFENELFADPEGRSFICYIQMPYKTGAKIVVTNESDKPLTAIFFDINYTLTPWNEDNLYFHCFWNRDTATGLAKDYVILPKVKGRGRFVGSNCGVIANPMYEKSWWGEGEAKFYLDGDTEFPTLVGTGAEDYIASAWGLGKFINRFSGCTFADDSLQQWAFYRYHIPDPIFFRKEFTATIQAMGGDYKEHVIKMTDKGVKLIPVSIYQNAKAYPLYKEGVVADLKNKDLPSGWTNFYRIDDWSSTAYFYLDKPANELPLIQNISIRTYKLTGK